MDPETEKLLIQHVEEYPIRREEMRIAFEDIHAQIKEGLNHPKASEAVMELKSLISAHTKSEEEYRKEQKRMNDERDRQAKILSDKLEPVITALGVAGGLRRFTIWIAAFLVAWGITNGYFMKVLEALKK